MKALFRICCGLDVHSKSVTAAIAVVGTSTDESITFECKEFKTFRSDLRKMAQWLSDRRVELCVMEGTGIYWKTVYEVLEEADLSVILVNARHVKNVPGQKTDMQDSKWLAHLGMCGLLKASFVPPRDMRELRILTRYRMKVVGTRASEKNRLHKILSDAGVRLSCVVSDIDGESARQMIDALIEGKLKSLLDIAKLGTGRLKSDREEIARSLDGRLSDRHRFALKEVRDHIRVLDAMIARIDSQVVGAMHPYETQMRLIQTIPGFNAMSAAMLLAEIGSDMSQFASGEHLSSWAGMCPGNNESAGKKSPDALARGIVM